MISSIDEKLQVRYFAILLGLLRRLFISQGQFYLWPSQVSAGRGSKGTAPLACGVTWG
jgi:hypothetical protein